jgi:hypothetical protein
MTNSRSHEVLRGLFVEVLEQISEEDAFRLVEAYVAGKVINLEMALNSRGQEHRTAVRLSISDDWRPTQPTGSA